MTSRSSGHELEQSLANAITDVDKAYRELSWAIYETQQMSEASPDDIPGYKRALFLFQAIRQAQEIEI